MSRFDIAIIGGGLVGASFARYIAGSKLKVVVIDQKPAEDLYNHTNDNRGLAISYSGMQLLQNLKLSEKLNADSYPIKTVHVSEQARFGFTTLRAENYKLPALGYVIKASALGEALIRGLECLPDTTVIRPIETKQLVYDKLNESWQINLENQNINAKLLVLADGANSVNAQRVGISIIKHNSTESAIVANLTIDKPHADTAYERFTAEGILALLPFGKQRIKFVWTAHNQIIDAVSKLSDPEFITKIQRLFGFRLGKFIALSERKIFPINPSSAAKIYAKNLVLIGNAANTLHPVAAQGFNLGLRDASSLAKILIANNTLAEYATKRKRDHTQTLKYTNTLLTLFSGESRFLRLSRSIGLLAAQFIPSINKRITAQGSNVWIS